MMLDAVDETQPGRYVISQILGNDCLRYRPVLGGPEVVSTSPLNPHMFLTRLGVTDMRLPARIVHRPFWVSEN